jgi:hypothetical protein
MVRPSSGGGIRNKGSLFVIDRIARSAGMMQTTMVFEAECRIDTHCFGRQGVQPSHSPFQIASGIKLLLFGQNPEVGRERAPFWLGAQLFDRAGA